MQGLSSICQPSNHLHRAVCSRIQRIHCFSRPESRQEQRWWSPKAEDQRIAFQGMAYQHMLMHMRFKDLHWEENMSITIEMNCLHEGVPS